MYGGRRRIRYRLEKEWTAAEIRGETGDHRGEGARWWVGEDEDQEDVQPAAGEPNSPEEEKGGVEGGEGDEQEAPPPPPPPNIHSWEVFPPLPRRRASWGGGFAGDPEKPRKNPVAARGWLWERRGRAERGVVWWCDDNWL